MNALYLKAVIHRIDDLEKFRQKLSYSIKVIHRIDDLEKPQGQVYEHSPVIHRIDDLEIRNIPAQGRQ